MFMHRLPNGELTMHEGLPRELAIKRMEDHERWCQEHREELERDSQELFDQMFGGDVNNWSAASTSWQGVTLQQAIRQTLCL